LERNKDIRHTQGNKIYMIKRFIIDVLWREIISYLWVHERVRLDVL
jgi:hypothetical protein